VGNLSQSDVDLIQVELTADWFAFRRDADMNARARIIEGFLPFARMLAAKLFAKRTYAELEYQDYLQYATIGLVESVDRFDPNCGVKFETFSSPRITGAILNGIETLGEKQQQVSARKRALAPRVNSIKAGVSMDYKSPEALFSRLAEVAIGLAIGFVLEDSGMYQADIEPAYPDNTYQRIELRQLQKRIVSLVNLLPRNERSVITYHYLQHLPFGEIAAILGVTKGRVSQIHKEALQKLQASIRFDDTVDLSF